jgi:hypothetical protein
LAYFVFCSSISEPGRALLASKFGCLEINLVKSEFVPMRIDFCIFKVCYLSASIKLVKWSKWNTVQLRALASGSLFQFSDLSF